MRNNIKVNIQYFLSRGLSKDLLLKTAKEGIYLEEQTLADMEVYSIFKPILSVCHIPRTDYMSKITLKQAYMKVFTMLYKEYRKSQKEKNEEVSIDELGKKINSISASWSKVYANASSENKETKNGLELDEISFLEFYHLDEQTRKNLAKIASEKTYSSDCSIYQAYKRELKDIKEVEFIEFIQNNSLKEQYRQKTEMVRKTLEEQEHKEVSTTRAIAKVKSSSKEWYEYIASADIAIPSNSKTFSKEYPLERFCIMTKEEKRKIEDKVNNLVLDKIKKQKDELTEMLTTNSKIEKASTSQK